jgi:hypothetical protein
MTNIDTEQHMAAHTDDDRTAAILEFAEFDRQEHKEVYDDLADE